MRRRGGFRAVAAPYVGTKAMRSHGGAGLVCAVCTVASVLGLPSCTESQARAAAVSSTLAPGARLAGPTVTLARKQNWYCGRIERAIASLAEAMLAAKTRAELEEQKLAPTLARTFARVSGPPGAGNAALAEFQDLRSDADQLNDLLREKGCATFPIWVDAPEFLK
jgi:hypothetical protein